MHRSTRSVFPALVLSLLTAGPAFAAYNVVSANSSTALCIFSPTCNVPANDYVAQFALPGASGNGRLQSRIFQGEPGSPGVGKWVYLYRVNMTNVVGITQLPSVGSIAIPSVGPALPYDYNFDGIATDHVLYFLSGIGTKGISQSFVFWGWTYFYFTSAISAGSYPGGGESSYFFGFASNYPPVVRTINVHTNTGTITVNGYAPQYP